VFVLPSYLRVPDVGAPGFGLLVVNSYLIRAAEPILIDTGMPIVRQEFLDSLWSLIDPGDLHWILLTHDDGDHTGALLDVMAAAPQARVVTQFVGMARLETCSHLPCDRFEIRNAGDTLTIAGRQLSILRPPLFDSPATSAYFDHGSGVLFCADSFGAIIPALAEDVAEVPEAAYQEGFSIFNRLNHPWFSLLDQRKFDEAIDGIRRLQPSAIGSCHSPLAKGRQVEAHLQAMSAIPSHGPLALPDQAALDGILAQIQAAPGHGS
jgi:flavorubredoxin